MISPKITEILSSLNSKAKERLSAFLQSPYHNSGYNSKKIVELFDQLILAQHENRLLALEKEQLNQMFYPEHVFIAQKKNPIDALCSDLLAKMKDFLFFEEAQKKQFDERHLLAQIRFYRRNNYEDRFWQVVRQFRRLQERQQGRDAFFYLNAFLLEREVAVFRSIFNTYTDDANLTLAHQCLDQFYATQKLDYGTILAFQKQLGESVSEEDMRTIELIMTNYATHTAFHTPLAELYRVILDWISDPPSAEDLERFSFLLQEKRKEVTHEKFRNLMAFYRYFLGLQYRKEVAGTALLQKILDVYKEHLDEGYFLVDDDMILPQSLHSIITVATKLGEISWAKEVLWTYPPERITGTRYPNEAHALCEALILFTNEEYEAAQETLVYRNFENINYSILADVLLIRIYYVLDNELMYNRIPALEKKVRRSKLTKREKSAYVNFLRVLLRILKYQHDRHSKKWQKLQTDVAEIVPVVEREWLSSIMLEPVV
ncbi:MAG: hypothetical protein AAFZ63_14910 [Bacteroidota bacterium]